MTNLLKFKNFSNHLLLPAVFLLTLFLQQAYASPEAAAPKQHGKFLGTGSCASTVCHGSVSPRNSTAVLQNEYFTWQKKDKHAQAWTVLTGEEGQRIGHNLGLAHPEKEALCLNCHATYVHDAAQQGEKFRVEDGVSCESCHGAAENWISTHTAKSASHQQNLSNGMADIGEAAKRVPLCLGCHYGTENNYVSHRIMGAGHPRLTFEMDTFGMIQPKHWEVDDDYKKRKEDYSPARAWLYGQTILATHTMDAVSSNKRSKDGLWPELTLFNCYTCHHSLAEKQYKNREYDGKPGELRLNLSSLIITREALKVLDKSLADKLEAELSSVQDLYHQGQGDQAFSSLRTLLNGSIKQRIEGAKLDETTLRNLLKQMTRFGAETGGLYYETAEQVAMGISSIVSQLSPKGNLYQQEIGQLYKALGNPEEFKPDGFTAACNSLLRVV